MALQRRGIAFFSFYLLTVPGRVSGVPRTTPVSPLFLDDACYIVSIGDTQWVENARVAGSGTLARGRRRQQVRLAELPAGPDKVRILREFPVRIPHGVPFLIRVHAISAPGSPDDFERAADSLAVFRAHPA
jgi:hypothetical protein